MSIREIFGPWLLTSFLLVKRHGEGVLTTFVISEVDDTHGASGGNLNNVFQLFYLEILLATKVGIT